MLIVMRSKLLYHEHKTKIRKYTNEHKTTIQPKKISYVSSLMSLVYNDFNNLIDIYTYMKISKYYHKHCQLHR
jgi:hypothetical protein